MSPARERGRERGKNFKVKAKPDHTPREKEEEEPGGEGERRYSREETTHRAYVSVCLE